jgi:RimJ/RimL family protein N-acetyltransferase
MNITFEPLKELHFPLMLKWLETTHVKKWWDQDVVYTIDLVKEKYASYAQGYKQEKGVNKPVFAYIINVNLEPIGYIQLYNAYDFPRDNKLVDLPKNLGAFDIFIGEEQYLGKNLGSSAISKFLSSYGSNYSHIFVDPDSNNIAAIKSYEKAGFIKFAEQKYDNEIWMLKDNRTTIIYLTGKPGVGKYTIAKELAKNNDFIICDNQLINNPIFELLQYDGYTNIPEFAWDSIRVIRTEVLAFLSKKHDKSYVLTNNLAENEKDRGIYEEVRHMAEKRGSLFIPVRLLVSKDEHLKRLTLLMRRERWKSIDPIHAEGDDSGLLKIDHPNFLELEISNLSAVDAADKIMKHVEELKS